MWACFGISLNSTAPLEAINFHLAPPGVDVLQQGAEGTGDVAGVIAGAPKAQILSE